MNKNIYILNGLDCPHCAEKIALKIGKIEGVTSSNIDFIEKKLYIEHNLEENDIFKSVVKIVKSLEPDVKVTKLENSPKESEESDYKFDIVKIIVAGVLFALSFFTKGKLSEVLLIVAYIVSGYEVIIEAVRNILKGRPFDENFLMAVASIGAMIIGEMNEGVAVMVFYQVGELFQKIAVDSSKKSIKNLMELKPEIVNVKTENGIKQTAPENVKIGDVMVMKAGERIALDGKLLSNSTTLDMSALTGESLPVDLKENDEILSGSINLSNVCEIEVTKTFENSAVAKLLEMVENSTSQKAKTEKFITRFARVYTPIVVISALLLALVPPILSGFVGFSKWIYRALVFLVISCPCALVISVPLSFFAGIGCASKNGILIKGAKYIEVLSECKTVAFDKTGTITKGEFKIQKIDAINCTENELLRACASIEKNSNHPVAKSILKEFKGEFLPCENIKEITGCGISGKINGKEVICANADFIKSLGIDVSDDENYTAICVVIDKMLYGVIYLGDSIKETSIEAVKNLYDCGVTRTVMLTGDKQKIAENIAQKANITKVVAKLLPEQKVREIEKLSYDNNGAVAFAGDGINDAPVIARADVGFSMGSIGSDIAIESADVVIMNDDLRKISDAIKISKRTMKIAKQNIVFALGIKLVILLLGALGLAGMWLAVFADVGVSVIAILNSLRAMNCKNLSVN